MASKKKLLQAAAGSAGGAGLDVDEVFSTFLYDGNGSAQTITNGIDLSGEGGLVRHKKNKTVHLVTAVREIKGRVAFFHLEGFSPQEVFYSDDVKVINETR